MIWNHSWSTDEFSPLLQQYDTVLDRFGQKWRHQIDGDCFKWCYMTPCFMSTSNRADPLSCPNATQSINFQPTRRAESCSALPQKKLSEGESVKFEMWYFWHICHFDPLFSLSSATGNYNVSLVWSVCVFVLLCPSSWVCWTAGTRVCRVPCDGDQIGDDWCDQRATCASHLANIYVR